MNKDHKLISDVHMKITKYEYTLNNDGTRNIDKDHPEIGVLDFSFDMKALSYIVFRDGPSILNIGKYRLYFTYKDNNLTGICLESSEDGHDYVYIVNNYKKVLDTCKTLYSMHYMINEVIIKDITKYPGETEFMSDDDYLDEFDLEDQ